MRVSARDAISLCQQEQSADNYTGRCVIVGLQCINPSLQNYIWGFSGAKTICTGVQRSGKKVTRSYESSFTKFSTRRPVHVWRAPMEGCRICACQGNFRVAFCIATLVYILLELITMATYAVEQVGSAAFYVPDKRWKRIKLLPTDQ